MNRFLLAFAVFSAVQFSAQQNYKWLKLKPYKVATLSDSLKETSGLAFRCGHLYTFNDGGNTSELFEIDRKTGHILKKIETGLRNSDWEAIAADSTAFYIADIGNNWGMRKDLKIIKLRNAAETSEINFNYPEQKDFSKKPQTNDWDAESIILKDGRIHVLTKQWQSHRTAHYEIREAGQPATLLEEYSLGYLSTDAAYYLGQLYIIGYTKKMEVFLSVFHEDASGLFFSRRPEKYYLGSASGLGQVEGLAVNEEGIYISAEALNLKIFHAPQSLYFIPKEVFDKVSK